MRTRPLGRSGIDVSVVTLGSMNFGKDLDEREGVELVAAYLDHGGNFLDTADCYADGLSETIVGAARRRLGDRFAICTKTGRPMFDDERQSGYAPQRLRNALEASLRRLGVDHVEMYQLHQWDPAVPVEDAVETLAALRDEGKIGAFGIGNVPAWALGQAYGFCRGRAIAGADAYQYHYSLGCRDAEAEILPACVAHGAGLMAWSPLSGGLLTGKYATQPGASGPRRGDKPVGRRGYGFERLADGWPAICESLRLVADRTGTSMTAVALSWLLSRPGVVTAVIGARSPAQLAETIGTPLPELGPEYLAALTENAPAVTPYPQDFLTQVLPGWDLMAVTRREAVG
ncbi:aldo/keto reductase [Streptomyces canus]|uniref:aldo/keto reductase n=1 Tax=Streptomyces canus TaxID=58343 RepID=UPI0030E49CDA